MKKKYTTKLYPSAPIEPFINVEERIKQNDIKTFHDKVKKKEIITYLNKKILIRKLFNNCKSLFTNLKAIDTPAFFPAKSIFSKHSVTGFGYAKISIFTGKYCVKTIAIDVICEISRTKQKKIRQREHNKLLTVLMISLRNVWCHCHR